MAGAAKNQRLAMTGSHDLHPTRLFLTLVLVQVFEGTDMVYLKLICPVGCPALFAYLSQKPLFEFRSVVPDLRWLVVKRCLDIPFQGNASPGCYQWLLSLAGNGDLQSLGRFSRQLRAVPGSSGRCFLLRCGAWLLTSLSAILPWPF